MISRKLILPIVAVAFVLYPLLNSCSSTQMAALPCPEPVKNSYLKKPNKKNADYKYFARHKSPGKNNSKLFTATRNKAPTSSTRQYTASNNADIALPERQYTEAPVLIESQNGPFVENEYSLVRMEPFNLQASTDIDNSSEKNLTAFIPAECDTIFLKTGKITLGKVAEIGAYEVRYRRCDNLDGPVIVVRKAELAEIRYQNGSREYFTDADPNVKPAAFPPAYSPVADQRIIEGLGLAGFIASLVGLFIAGIPLGIIAVIFGLVSLSKIKKQPGRFKGRGFAIASFIIGLVDIVAMIIILGMAV